MSLAGKADNVEVETHRIEYRRPGLVEWYDNGCAGLMHGFTVERNPDATARELRFVLDVATGLEIAATPCGLGAHLVCPNRGELLYRYEGLVAWDAMGTALNATIESSTGEIRLRVETDGAVFPVTVDPIWVEEAKLTASDGSGGDRLGESIAVDGDTVVIGAPRESGVVTNQRGAVYVFVRSGGSWSQQAKLTASDASAGDRLGESVAVSGDTIAAGAPRESGTLGPNERGAVYVFTRSGTSWSQQQKLLASDAAGGACFGQSVTVQGNRLVAGAVFADDTGAAYVFERSGTTWTEADGL